jgi:hypothetical protein
MTMTSSLFTPPGIVLSAAVFTPRESKLNGTTSYYLRLGFDKAGMATPAFAALEKAVAELGRNHFGSVYELLVKSGQMRLPFQRNVKDTWRDVVCFVNMKSCVDFPPTVVGRDGLPLLDQKLIYRGCKARASVGLYAYGGRGTSFGAGISIGLNNVQWLADGPRLAGARGGGSELGAIAENDELASLVAQQERALATAGAHRR